eukprot:Blabericola_migrator_1__4010@NODE_2219_length_3107_cov_26_714145_g1398_i0_p3_GENE_NODE_2219_length_3107_cov_26_714145_g1398_i0NODE_2219_length_3107_cov_26_714145_g1398_i0_p3_ORF_typecomplete_len113_score6_57Alpha_GJ/PF03229_13/0_059Med3/PF11593_8/5_3_NODE_2219_length_3107_cov_26_714145_g1398_i064402
MVVHCVRISSTSSTSAITAASSTSTFVTTSTTAATSPTPTPSTASSSHLALLCGGQLSSSCRCSGPMANATVSVRKLMYVDVLRVAFIRVSLVMTLPKIEQKSFSYPAVGVS